MKIFSLAVANLLMCSVAFCQSKHKVSTYIAVQNSVTVYDATKGNNPFGIGAGLQAFYNNNTRFKPSAELTADAYLADDKVFRTYQDGKEIKDVNGVVSIFAGGAFCPLKQFYIACLAGPAFINSNVYVGIKPSVSYYFFEKQKLGIKLSYINIFNRTADYEKAKMADFGSVSFALSLKLF